MKITKEHLAQWLEEQAQEDAYDSPYVDAHNYLAIIDGKIDLEELAIYINEMTGEK